MDDWLARVAGVRQWSRGDERAAHKPLLLLYALGRFQREPDAGLRYSEVEHELAQLLTDFGPPRETSPRYPFHYLVSDGVWEVHTADGGGSPGPSRPALLSSGATGRLAPGLRTALATDPALLGGLARLLLDSHFPESLHPDICLAVGLDLDSALPGRPLVPAGDPRRRDPAHRERILVAYEYRCAFCGYDGTLSRTAVGLEAAHVRWWAYGGPDEVGNGLCLCALHHKLFGQGVLGLDLSRRILVSQRFVGRSESARRFVLDLVNQPVLGPQPGSTPVAPAHIAWHTRQVFHGAARAAGVPAETSTG